MDQESKLATQASVRWLARQLLAKAAREATGRIECCMTISPKLSTSVRQVILGYEAEFVSEVMRLMKEQENGKEEVPKMSCRGLQTVDRP